VLRFDIDWMRHNFPPDDAVIQGRLDKIDELLEDTIATVRNISLELRPSLLDDFGLYAAIELLELKFNEHTPITCKLNSSPMKIKLFHDLELCVFRTVQEALTNVARHSEAQNVTISLIKTDSEMIVKVSDDGKGMNLDVNARGQSLGLTGIEDRARALAGVVKIDSSPGNGTTVELRLPSLASEQKADNQLPPLRSN